jgi:SAM-dependent methyltransferase
MGSNPRSHAPFSASAPSIQAPRAAQACPSRRGSRERGSSLPALGRLAWTGLGACKPLGYFLPWGFLMRSYSCTTAASTKRLIGPAGSAKIPAGARGTTPSIASQVTVLYDWRVQGSGNESRRSRTHSPDGDSWTEWTHEIRRIEFDGMMRYIPLGRDSTTLELGCGDGFQQTLLRERFARVFAIDPKHAPARHDGFSFAVAEALPFGASTFDLVVSNCVLEHLSDRSRGMEETVRALRPGGYVAHVVPSRFWKVASLLLNPLGYPLRVAEKWCALRQMSREGGASGSLGAQAATRPGIAQVLGRWVYPPIHGTYGSHLAEYESYGRDRWLECLRHPHLVHVADAPLVAATQFGFLRFRFVALRKRLARRGLGSSRVFVMRKVT